MELSVFWLWQPKVGSGIDAERDERPLRPQKSVFWLELPIVKAPAVYYNRAYANYRIHSGRPAVPLFGWMVLDRSKETQMKASIAALLLAVAMAPAVMAQTPNDVNRPATGGAGLVGPFTTAPVAGTPSCPAGPVSTAFSGTTTQLGRIFRDAAASACPSKAYPGLFNAATTYNYEAFTYTNTDAAAACVTVNFDPDTVGATPCTTNAHASAYIGTYDPAQPGHQLRR